MVIRCILTELLQCRVHENYLCQNFFGTWRCDNSARTHQIIKGLSHKEWATYEFPKVLDLINESTSKEINLPTTEFLDSINNMNSHTKSNNNRKSNDHIATTSRNDGTQDETDEDDLFSSVESLWEENAKLKTSLNSLDSNFVEISKTLNQIREYIQNQDKRILDNLKKI